MNGHIMQLHPANRVRPQLVYAKEDLRADAPDWDRAHQLSVAHYAEISAFKRVLNKVNLDIERYLSLARNDRLHLVTVRDPAAGSPHPDGLLMGYSIHLIHPHIHYRHVLVAEDDLHYVVPDLRNQGVGKTLRETAIAGLKSRGVKLVIARTKVNHMHETHLAELGFDPMEMVYAKMLVD
jgi:GNAT superfamily N-acetyltransferase